MQRLDLWLRKSPGLWSVALPLTLQAVRAGSGASRFLQWRVSVLVLPHGLLQDAVPLSTLSLGFTSVYLICFSLSELFLSFLFPFPSSLDFSFQLGLGPSHINLWRFVQWLVEFSTLTWVVSVYIGVLLCCGVWGFFSPKCTAIL